MFAGAKTAWEKLSDLEKAPFGDNEELAIKRFANKEIERLKKAK